jgi:hypothetical protein
VEAEEKRILMNINREVGVATEAVDTLKRGMVNLQGDMANLHSTFTAHAERVQGRLLTLVTKGDCEEQTAACREERSADREECRESIVGQVCAAVGVPDSGEWETEEIEGPVKPPDAAQEPRDPVKRVLLWVSLITASLALLGTLGVGAIGLVRGLAKLDRVVQYVDEASPAIRKARRDPARPLAQPAAAHGVGGSGSLARPDSRSDVSPDGAILD